MVFPGCESHVSEDIESLVLQDTEEQEYFSAVIDERQFELAHTDGLTGELLQGKDKGNKIFSFRVFRGDPFFNHGFYEEFLVNISFFNGVGVYRLGSDFNDNYCYYWNGTYTWHSDHTSEASGIINILKTSDNFIEGDFKLRAISNYNFSESILIHGEFGVKINP